ncbi:Hypothetical protein CINCED_3A000349 [Cinara cedri]|uniref:Uncharacterized protein n=1 Tax=Cinara cedri TaxID=506608 RepID=A0A5E4NAE7_9HEMI|nr:Hypothetical protein CINCED_3A000349 [Cinara cedri]
MQFLILIWTVVATSMVVESVRVSDVDSEFHEMLRYLRGLRLGFLWPEKKNSSDVSTTISRLCPTGMLFSSMCNKCVVAGKLCPEDYKPDFQLEKCIYIGVSTTESISAETNSSTEATTIA